MSLAGCLIFLCFDCSMAYHIKHIYRMQAFWQLESPKSLENVNIRMITYQLTNGCCKEKFPNRVRILKTEQLECGIRSIEFAVITMLFIHGMRFLNKHFLLLFTFNFERLSLTCYYSSFSEMCILSTVIKQFDKQRSMCPMHCRKMCSKFSLDMQFSQWHTTVRWGLAGFC